ncbi:hypothetical protein FHR83_004694 [Actinoplanes campanulatus]|uniref:Uncharacterized protein n=1 Tax=Actinoplanes campanulatus TaxID=113559 RepID=A0A7W5AJR7_9ACTN|nr:hypothetical protein [Actinoplanes campanulatus]
MEHPCRWSCLPAAGGRDAGRAFGWPRRHPDSPAISVDCGLRADLDSWSSSGGRSPPMIYFPWKTLGYRLHPDGHDRARSRRSATIAQDSHRRSRTARTAGGTGRNPATRAGPDTPTATPPGTPTATPPRHAHHRRRPRPRWSPPTPPAADDQKPTKTAGEPHFRYARPRPTQPGARGRACEGGWPHTEGTVCAAAAVVGRVGGRDAAIVCARPSQDGAGGDDPSRVERRLAYRRDFDPDRTGLRALPAGEIGLSRMAG